MTDVQPAMDRLVDVIQRLRGPDGCPWDREQTLDSLRPYLIEESYELLEAVESGDPAKHREELGDVLLQILLHAQIRDEQADFNLKDVVEQLTKKLIRRHPHVFGDVQVDGAEDVLKNWETIKAKERNQRRSESVVHGIPAALPALQRAQRIQSRAARVGFDWEHEDDVLDKIHEEIDELRVELDRCDAERAAEEVGDLLFSIVNFCRFRKIDAEGALRGSASRFVTRFQGVERRVHAEAHEMSDCSLAELDAHWDAVKREE
jgi:MazG family protein